MSTSAEDREGLPWRQRLAHILAVDWGTTNLRAYVSRNNIVVAEFESDKGLVEARKLGFERSLKDTIGDIFDLVNIEGVIMCGMVGAKEGWAEAPYVKCPCSAEDVAASLKELPPFQGAPAFIVPGVSCERDGRIDVMRGEETQVFGAFVSGEGDPGKTFKAAIDGGTGNGTYVLPGTHTKWARVRDGKIVGFRTFMTGDVYKALRDHTVFGMEPSEGEGHDDEAYTDGVREGAATGSGGDLLSRLFTARTLRLFGRLDRGKLSSYLSGMVIGAEVAEGKKEVDGEVLLIGSGNPTELYRDALFQLGVKYRHLLYAPVVHSLTEFLAYRGIKAKHPDEEIPGEWSWP